MTVERNVVFSKPDFLYEGPFNEGIMDESEGENNGESVSLNHDTEAEDPPTTQGNDGIPNPENTTMPKVRRSEHHKQPSRYIRDLLSGEFTTRSKNKKFPTGLQVPELEEEITAVTMLTRMSEACRLEPRSLTEAMKSPDWPRWREAMDEEMEALKTHKTWEVVDTPKGVNIVGCHWTYVVKQDASGNIARYKAQLVAQGFSQVQGVDFFNMYALVTKMATI